MNISGNIYSKHDRKVGMTVSGVAAKAARTDERTAAGAARLLVISFAKILSEIAKAPSGMANVNAACEVVPKDSRIPKISLD